MDINLMRSVITVVLFVAFIGIVVWAWGKGRRADFDAAARLPLDDDLAEREIARNGRVQQ
ncbi:MAG: cbb3-type cytochrome c oxidase subunit 3 [Betaproteobacteria bacterium]|nr:MAG: cbb3-type cytochrome c oxidase subunit 3 [Betaproteobacteria bacterium]